jgi:methyl-accepting chemotaxis protein
MLKSIKIKTRLPILFLVIGIIPMIIMVTIAYRQIKKTYVMEVAMGQMNFVDAKQQGVIRFLDQNRKMAVQLSLLASSAKPAPLSNYFKKIVETDVFDPEKHPFYEEIKSGKRKIPALQVYHFIDYVRGGKIIASSDTARIGKRQTEKVSPKWGYSDPYFEDGKLLLTFSSKTADGVVNIHADGKMLTNIVNGEIGNLPDGIGAFYLAGVGKTMDFYLVNRENMMLTESRVYPDAILNQKGSVEPWGKTLKGHLDPACKEDGKYITNAGGDTGCREAMGFYESQNGKLMLGSSMPFYDSEWTVAVEQEASEILAPLNLVRNSMLLGTGLMALFIVILSFFISRAITKPVNEIAESMKDIASGNLTDKHIAVKSDDEIGVLAGALKDIIAYLKTMARTAEEIAEGDLRSDVRPKSEKDVLGNAFKRMIEGLRGIVTEIRAGSDQLASASTGIATTTEKAAKNNESAATAVEETTATMHEMAANIQNVARSTQRQSSSVTETSTSIEQLASSIQRIASTSQRLIELSQKTRQVVDIGLESVDKSVKGTEEISRHIMLSADTIAALGSRAEDIGKIVDVIDDIAEQTNLLALNAAIEAARVGEHGLGFAVVAEEVKKLAERSAKSTKEIAELISGIQKEAQDAVKLMDKSTQIVEKGVELSSQVSDALGAIETSVGEVDEFANEIGMGTREQSSGSAQMATAAENQKEVTQEIMSATDEQATSTEQTVKTMEKMREMIQQNTTGSVEIASSAEQLSLNAERFLKIVGRFTLNGSEKAKTGFHTNPYKDRNIEKKTSRKGMTI